MLEFFGLSAFFFLFPYVSKKKAMDVSNVFWGLDDSNEVDGLVLFEFQQI